MRVLLALVLATASLGACASMPPAEHRVPSTAYTDTSQTRLGQALAAPVSAHPGLTGVRPLYSGVEAFAARLVLVQAAQRSIDVQTYIWRDDTSGTLLAQALLDAADRGVRVRLLLDDATTRGLDDFLATLAAHANVEVRLFNPFRDRLFRLWDYAGDFGRAHRRMHNKAFVADNQVAIVGGRKIGDEYFGATPAVDFLDVDVAVAGDAVRHVSQDFDEFWNSEFAFPAIDLLRPPSAARREQVQDDWRMLAAQPDAARYLEAVRNVDLMRQIASRSVSLEWVPAHLVADHPDKIRHPPGAEAARTLPRLERALGHAHRDLVLVSAYFVPGQGGTDALRDIAARGVQVLVLTNSLAATDVPAVYAGYAPYRRALLDAGVRLFELRPTLAAGAESAHRHLGLGSSGPSSGASLHAKTFTVDGSRVYVGSFNLDPRSDSLNTEMGLVIESPSMAAAIDRAFDGFVPRNAYELRESAGNIEWIEHTPTQDVRHTNVPGASRWRQVWSGFLSLLPIEWLL